MDVRVLSNSIVAVSVTLVVSIGVLAGAHGLMERLDVPSIDDGTRTILEQFFPEADEFIGVFPAGEEPEDETPDDPAGYPIYRVKTGGELAGTALRGSGEGYQSTVRVLVAVDTGGAIKGVSVVHQDETPGLGDVIKEERFLDQFTGKTAGDPIQIGEDIDGISGATWSVQGTAEAVRTALSLLEETE